MSKIGVYHITHIASNRKYIGSSTVNIKKRFTWHKYFLTNGNHPNKKLQNAWNKYGKEAFVFGILDYCDEINEVTLCEQQWMDSLKPYYNIRKIATNNTGLKAWNKNKVMSETYKHNCSLRARALNLRPPNQTGKKFPNRKCKKPMSIETRQRIGEAVRKRRNLERLTTLKPRDMEAYALRSSGLSWANIGKRLELSPTGAKRSVLRIGTDPKKDYNELL